MLGFKNIKNSGNKALTTKTGRNEAVSGITPRTVVKPIRDWRICVIGGAPDALPAMPGCRCGVSASVESEKKAQPFLRGGG